MTIPRRLPHKPASLNPLALIAASLLLAGTAPAQLSATLTDFGSTAPVAGSDDQAQLTTPGGANNPDGLNYYFDNATPPGQTFTTGTNPYGYVLNSLAIATAGNSGSLAAAGQAYTLSLYSVSGATAKLLITYQSQSGFTFTDLDWLAWTGLGFGLQPNTTYAYTLHRNTAGWENLANITGNLYPGGEVCLIPPAGGVISYGSSHAYDAAFDAGLTVAATAFANPPAIAPAAAVTVGTTATLTTAPAVGPGPLHYQWQTDGGSGGTLTNIPGANSTTLAVNTTGYRLGVYNFAVVVTNSTSSSTSLPASLTIYQSGTTALTDAGTTITPGIYDLSQLTSGGSGDGLNYYDDNATAPGQTFTTGANPQGYYLTSVTVGTGGGGSSGTATVQGYNLNLFSVNGTTAILMASLTNAGSAFAYGDWVTCSGFTPLQLNSNSVYAYTFHRGQTGWAGMSSTPNTADLYPNGQLCLIPSVGGTITFGGTGLSDAAFDVGLSPIGVGPSPYPFANTIAISPSVVNVAGTPVTLSESATGNNPLAYQWRTDGGGGGSLTNIPGATASNLVWNTTGWKPSAYNFSVVVSNSFGTITSVVSTVTLVYANTTAQLTDIGTTDPQPLLADDAAQLSMGGGTPDGLNYYFDNGTPPGQTFTTSGNAAGYTLTSLAVRTGTGNTGSLPAGGQAYVLRLYTVSNGTNASLYALYTSQTNFAFTHEDWLRWSGLALPLQANTTYAYSFGRIATGTGWDNMSSVGANPYAGGEVALIPLAGGPMLLGSSHDFDATFIVGVADAGFPLVSPPSVSPSNSVYAGTWLNLSATASGAATYQWQTDGGNSGSLTNIPGANSLTLTTSTVGLDGLTVAYRLVAANGSLATTGEVAMVTVAPASAPVTINDTTPASANRFVGGSVTFSASFAGTLPITNQWQVDTGTGYTNLVGQTNLTLTLTNLQFANAGTYSLYAANSQGSANSSGAGLQIFGTPGALTTVNFQWHSTEGGDAGLYTSTGISGFGAGTTWNTIAGPGSWLPGTYASSTGLTDDGAVETGISLTLVTAGSWSMTANTTLPLLDSYAIAYGTQSFTFSLPNGLYNLVFYSCNGSESSTANSGGAFTVNGITKTAIPTQCTSLVAGNNYVVFSNLLVTGQSLAGTWSDVTGFSFGSFNGAQVRYLGQVNLQPTNLTAQVSGSQLNLSWPADHAGWTLQAQTNALGAGLGTNWVDVAASSSATQYGAPVNGTNSSVFYRLILRQ